MNQTTQGSSANRSESRVANCDDHQGQVGILIEQPKPKPVSNDDKKNSHHKMSGWARIRVTLFACSFFKNKQPVKIQLCEAAMKGDWKAVEKLADQLEHEKIKLSDVVSEDRNETVLHIATRFNNTAFVEKLMPKLTEKDLEAKNRYGNTPLCIAAMTGAAVIAKLIVERHEKLVLERGSGKALPLLIAARYKQFHMVPYLLEAMKSHNEKMDDKEKKELLFSAISSNDYDIALVILKRNKKLALQRDDNEDTPLHIMARKSNGTIGTKNYLTKCQLRINKCCKHIYRNKMMQAKAHKMVRNLWDAVKNEIQKDPNLISHPSSVLHDAASVGNVDFLRILLDKNPELLRMEDDNKKSIFHVAVENRQRDVFNLIYDMKLFNPDDLLYYFNEDNISLLELAVKRPSPNHLDQVSGAVFQVHQELLWFKEVEDIAERTTTRKDKRSGTLQELYIKEHKQLMEEGKEWVKSTANSCLLVATLIATVVFTAAFTVPGGNNGNNGAPLFLHHKWFTVFVISDSIALISSSTAILLFMSILTSRYAKRDFLFWLPLQLVFGLGFLFLSVLGMVLAFSSCMFMHFEKNISWIPLLTTWMTIVPISWFCLLQWKLWADGFVALHATGMSFLLKVRNNGVFR